MADNLGQVVQQLREAGLEVESPQITGKVVRCKAEGDRGASKAGWYCLFELRRTDGSMLVVGSYGNWRTGEKGKIQLGRDSGLSEAERKAYRDKVKRDRAKAERQRKHRAKRAARRADAIWRRLPTEGRSPYLERKGVKGHGVRYGKRGTVIVPMRDIHGGIHGLQVIYPSAALRSVRPLDAGQLLRQPERSLQEVRRWLRGKDYWPPGLDKAGHFHLVGGPIDNVVLVAEGYATGASLHEATTLPVAVAFDTAGLEPVGVALRKRYPEALIVFCADDDFLTTSPPAAVDNPGVTYANAAAMAVNGQVCVPVFRDRGERKLTDFNDLHLEEGIAAVREQAQVLSANRPVQGSESPPPQRGEGVSDETAVHTWRFDLDTLIQHYTLIYGTDTVFDGRLGQIINLQALRNAAGKELVRMWLEHPARKMVAKDGVIFEPAAPARPGTVNMFRGWPLEPEPGDCEALLELLFYLCDQNLEAYEWILKWTAYPLQFPGAKMQTAVVMHGPEGTGKNLWWGAVKEIYGEYAGIITQTELESQYNDWASRKLFIIGNEVVSRQEMYHQKGRLKNLITETVLPVNEKYMPTRQEANHANIVFLSNAYQPATPDPGDRRYMVVWTPPAKGDGFYRTVARQAWQDGGIAALYDHLLRLDLSDFDAHTKPPLTQAKSELIEASMDSHERFWRQWKAGDLPIPYVPCRSMDCYRAYLKWCTERGERSPARESVFANSMAKRMVKTRKRIHPPNRGQGDAVQCTMFLPDDVGPPDDQSERKWLSEHATNFLGHLDDWQQGQAA